MSESKYVANPIFYTDEKNDIMISKSNTLIEAGFELTLAEHNLMTLAINKLHKQATNNHEVFITAQEFSIANKLSDSHAYQILKETVNDLMDRKVRFPLYIDLDKKDKAEPNSVGVLPPKHGRFEVVNAKYNWLQGVAYADKQGFIYLHFSDPLRFLIDKTGDAYTNYNYTKTIDMRSFNSKRLYELVCKWKDLGTTKSMHIDEWKDFFGVPDKYPNVAEFKRWVLLPSINTVNKQGDFSLILKQSKVGRIITHFQILITKNNEIQKVIKKSKNLDDLTDNAQIVLDILKSNYFDENFIKMSDAQLDMFSSKLSELPSVQSMANIGEEMPAFKARLRTMLKDPEKQKTLTKYLKEVGFTVK